MKKDKTKWNGWLLAAIAGALLGPTCIAVVDRHSKQRTAFNVDGDRAHTDSGSYRSPRQRPALPETGERRRPALRPGEETAIRRAQRRLATATTRELTAQIQTLKERAAGYHALSADDRALYDVAVRLRAERRSQKPAERRLTRTTPTGARK